jgi:hypothetical protein
VPPCNTILATFFSVHASYPARVSMRETSTLAVSTS